MVCSPATPDLKSHDRTTSRHDAFVRFVEGRSAAPLAVRRCPVRSCYVVAQLLSRLADPTRIRRMVFVVVMFGVTDHLTSIGEGGCHRSDDLESSILHLAFNPSFETVLEKQQ